MKKFLKLFFTVFILFLVNVALGQTDQEDVIYLKNGGVMRGKIQELQPEKVVKIEIIGGNIMVFPMNEVERISKEDKYLQGRGQRNYLKGKGHYGLFTPALNVGKSRWSTVVNGGIQIINGYRFSKYAGVGGGIGLEVFDNWVINPLFAEFRGHLLKGDFTPYYYGGIGYGATFLNENNDFQRVNGGILLQTGVGIATHLGGSSFFTFGLGWRQQNMYEKRTNWWWNGEPTTIVNHHQFNRMVFNIGILF
jgi:hypothetical protein